MFNVDWVETLVILAVIGLVLAGVYRLIGLAVNREMKKHEGAHPHSNSRH